MSIRTFLSDKKNVAKIATVVIFLALIRCISEPFRLQHYAEASLSFTDMKPFLIGALVAASALFAMTVLFYFAMYRTVIATCILTVVILLILKWIYFIH